jgi:hypothetical protein
MKSLVEAIANIVLFILTPRFWFKGSLHNANRSEVRSSQLRRYGGRPHKRITSPLRSQEPS